MIRLLGPGARLCDGLTRREAIRLGGIGAFGASLSLPDLAHGEIESTKRPPRFGQAESCIVLFLMGGPAQHSTWDPKPDAPPEVRGAYGSIATSVPGLNIGELLPLTARQGQHLCLLRAVSTGDNAHSSSGYYMLTGRPHAPKNFENAVPGAPNDAPCLGAMIAAASDHAHDMPPAVVLPHRIINTGGEVWPGQDSGFLGPAHDPWLLRVDQTESGSSRVAELGMPDDLNPERLVGRRGLLDRLVSGLDIDHSMDGHSRRAFDLLISRSARDAFRVDQEHQTVRDRYGPSPFGQHVLLARRLVEAGVRLVQVNWYRGPGEPGNSPVWDSHVDETNRLKTVLCPPFDHAFSALLEDLAARGLLERTLVLCLSEFGRTPRFEGSAGRGHWGSVFSVAMAGGGVRGGQAVGSSDAIGGQPLSGRVAPEDLLATAAHLLGVAPEREFLDRVGRPLPLSCGQVIQQIVG
jgi:Protein of unknown function (DUF1501)